MEAYFIVKCWYKYIIESTLKKIKRDLTMSNTHRTNCAFQNRNISESRRLIFHINEITNIQQMEGFLVKMDLKKTFDSLDHKFLISVLKKFEFGQNFITWIEIIFWNKEACVINDGIATKYFKLSPRKPNFSFLFFVALEILFILIKENPLLNRLNIFNDCYLYSAFADNANFFSKMRQFHKRNC